MACAHGGVAAILGALLAGIGNLIHPVTPRDDDAGVALVMAQTDAWTLIHLVIIAGTIGALVGLVGVRGALPREGFVGAMTRYGVLAGAIGTVLGILTVILDGVAAKRARRRLGGDARRPAGRRARLVATNETLNFAIAGMFNLTFAGLPFLAFGLAVAASRVFPAGWAGWRPLREPDRLQPASSRRSLRRRSHPSS